MQCDPGSEDREGFVCWIRSVERVFSSDIIVDLVVFDMFGKWGLDVVCS